MTESITIPLNKLLAWDGNVRKTEPDKSSLRIPTKKIIHSELKTITASPRNAVGMIVEQVIVKGQEESGDTVSIISFLPCLSRLLAQSLLEHATGRPSF